MSDIYGTPKPSLFSKSEADEQERQYRIRLEQENLRLRAELDQAWAMLAKTRYDWLTDEDKERLGIKP